jgi:hypothetical protein
MQQNSSNNNNINNNNNNNNNKKSVSFSDVDSLNHKPPVYQTQLSIVEEGENQETQGTENNNNRNKSSNEDSRLPTPNSSIEHLPTRNSRTHLSPDDSSIHEKEPLNANSSRRPSLQAFQDYFSSRRPSAIMSGM